MQVVEVLTKKQRRDFFLFPIKLYKGNKYNVPSLLSDEYDEFNPKKNGAFEFCKSKMFIAYDDGKVVGRVAVIINDAYNQKKNVRQVRFTRYDVIDDFEVTKALFDKVIAYARDNGMNEIIGPIGFSDFDKQGMLVEGFEEMDLYITMYNYPYYKEHMAKLGFVKDADWVEYKIKLPEVMDQRLKALAEKVQKRYGYEYVEFKGFKSAKPYIRPALKEIMNEVYAELYGVVAVNDRQIDREAAMIKQVFNNKMIFLIKKDDELAGYGFMAPNVSRSMQKAQGRITPLGILRVIRDLSNFDTVDLYSMGVKKKYQNAGVNVMIMAKGLENLIGCGVKYLETGPELETNEKIQSQWKSFERRIHRRRRCYKLSLDENEGGEN